MSRTQKIVAITKFVKRNHNFDNLKENVRLVSRSGKEEGVEYMMGSSSKNLISLSITEESQLPWDFSYISRTIDTPPVHVRICSYNDFGNGYRFRTLKGFPENADDVSLSHLWNLENLEGLPISVDCIDLNDCCIESFKGIPKNVEDITITKTYNNFNDRETNFNSNLNIDFFPEHIGGSVYLENLRLKDLRFIKCTVGYDVLLSDIKNIDLSYLPQINGNLFLKRCTFTNIDGVENDFSLFIRIDNALVSSSEFRKYVEMHNLLK